MTLSILFGFLFLVAVFLVIKQYRSDDTKKYSIAETKLAEGKLDFEIDQAGKFTIWTKRESFFNSTSRGIHNYKYSLTNKKTGEAIPLMNQQDIGKYAGRNNRPSEEKRSNTTHSFDAPAGSYTLHFEQQNIELGALDSLKKLGPFNPFKEINPHKYLVVVTAYYDQQNDISDAILKVVYTFFAVAALFAFFYVTFKL